jgi:hypothetical protein
MKYLLDYFKPYDGGGKCQTVKSNDYKGIDFKFNIRPATLELYGK